MTHITLFKPREFEFEPLNDGKELHELLAEVQDQPVEVTPGVPPGCEVTYRIKFTNARVAELSEHTIASGDHFILMCENPCSLIVV